MDDVTVQKPPSIEFGDEDVTSFLDVSFVFKHEEGKAGQHCPAQLCVTSNAFPNTPPVTLEKIQIQFDGSLRTIRLEHRADKGRVPKAPKPYVSRVSLAEAEMSSDDESSDDSESESQSDPTIVLEGAASLTISPDQTRVFEMDIPLREPGDAKASSVVVSVAAETFHLNYNMRIQETNTAGFWYLQTAPRRVARVNPQAIKILPKPPKMELKLIDKVEQYYTNETIRLEVEMLNEEDADAITKLDVHFYGQDIPGFKVRMADGDDRSVPSGVSETKLSGVPVGTIKSTGSARATILLDPVEEPSNYTITVKASYHLVSDPATPVIQLLTHQLNVVTPFEASYDLLPRLHSEWPSLFDCSALQNWSDDDMPARPSGLAQRWALVTRYCSFASEDLLVTDLDVKVLATHGAVTCTASKAQPPLPAEGQTVSPKTIEEAYFDLVSQKASLDDRAAATAEFAFEIRWRRPGATSDAGADDPPNVTTLPIPRFFVTVAEPRVLASVSYSSAPALARTPARRASTMSATTRRKAQHRQPLLVFLDITIENPSSHFLTFGLTMEQPPANSSSGNGNDGEPGGGAGGGGDEFAFSGAKTTTLNVLPVSRRTVTYRLLPLVRGAWIRPHLVVRDKYFQKVLRVVPTEGLKGDREGVLVWVPPVEEDEDEDEDEDEKDEGDEDKGADGKRDDVAEDESESESGSGSGSEEGR